MALGGQTGLETHAAAAVCGPACAFLPYRKDSATCGSSGLKEPELSAVSGSNALHLDLVQERPKDLFSELSLE